jgi:hypothetical protein
VAITNSVTNYLFRIGSCLIFFLSAILSFIGLSNTSLWDDEAQVAIIARVFSKSGVLSGWDGRNLFAYHNGSILDQHLRPINAPLDFLTTALSFHLFGVSTWTARLPFVVIGLASACVFFLLLRLEFGENRSLRFIPFTFFCLSTVYLLNIRTCRYYSLALFFSILTMYLFRRGQQTQKSTYFLGVSISALLLFYSSYLLCAAFLLGLIVAQVVTSPPAKYGIRWGQFALMAAVFVVGSLPYANHFHIWQRPDMHTDDYMHITRPQFFVWNLERLNDIGCLPWLIHALALIVIFWKRKDVDITGRMRYWLIASYSYLAFLAVLLPHPISDIRYLIPLFPMLTAVVGIVVWYLFRRSPPIAVLLGLVLLCTNFLSYTPENSQMRWLLPGYISENLHPYPTGSSRVSDYLRANAKQDDTVFACPEYFNYPLMFYVGDKLKFASLLTRDSRLPMELTDKLGAPLARETNFPNWIVAFGKQTTDVGVASNTQDCLNYFSRPHQENGVLISYHYALAKTLDVYWAQTQRPELPWHSFGPVTRFDPLTDAIYIYRRQHSAGGRQ